MVLFITVYMSLHTSKLLLSGSRYMSKKGGLSILSKRIVEGSEKNRVGVCSVYTMRHCLHGP